MQTWLDECVKLDVEGKTKKIFYFPDSGSNVVRVFSKDDITAGDGKRHAILPGKGILSNTTTANVFRLLQRNQIPVAFLEQDSPQSFLAIGCTMVDLEVVGRWTVDPKSSLLKRNPSIKVGVPFKEPLIEFFLKTSGKKWRDRPLPCDDPYLHPERRKGKPGWGVYEPNKPVHKENQLFWLPMSDLELVPKDVKEIIHWTKQIAFTLRDAWATLGLDFRDFKVEYGYPIEKTRLLVADVLDNDSWRLWWDGRDISKQPFRDGAPLDQVLRNYELVAEFSNHFPL